MDSAPFVVFGSVSASVAVAAPVAIARDLRAIRELLEEAARHG